MADHDCLEWTIIHSLKGSYPVQGHRNFTARLNLWIQGKRLPSLDSQGKNKSWGLGGQNGGEGGFPGLPFPRSRMTKTDPMGMEPIAAIPWHSDRSILPHQGHPPHPIQGIPHQGIADTGQMDADLVGPPCGDLQAHQGSLWPTT